MAKKTPEQIRAWLKAREWWPQFVKNTVAFDYRTAEVLSGDRGEDTGLKDIKGKRIYEGDIVQYNCSDKVLIGKVAWCSSFFEVDVKNGAESYALTSFCRVIGNIHDNPELLEGEGS